MSKQLVPKKLLVIFIAFRPVGHEKIFYFYFLCISFRNTNPFYDQFDMNEFKNPCLEDSSC